MNRTLRIAALLGLLAAASPSALATSLAQLSTEQLTDAADLIVRGEVERVYVEYSTTARVVTHAEVRVTEGLKGLAEPGDYVDVVSVGGRTADGAFMEVLGAPRFSEGEDTLLFLAGRDDGQTWGVVGMHLGKYSIKQNPTDGRPMVVRFTLPFKDAYDARFIPNPPKGERVMLDELVEQVRARVDLGWDGQPIPGVSDDHLRSINRLQPGVK